MLLKVDEVWMIQTIFEGALLLRGVAASVHAVARLDHVMFADGIADRCKLLECSFREGLFIDGIRANGFPENNYWRGSAIALSVHPTHSLDQSIDWGWLEVATIKIDIQTHLNDLCSN